MKDATSAGPERSAGPPRTMPLAGAALAAAIALSCATPPPASRSEAPAPLPTDTFSVVLLGTTDVHGRLYNHDYYTGRETDHGLALLKPLADSVRRAHPGRVFLFDAGDLLQGNPLGLVYARIHGDEPNPIIRAMNLMGYDASAIGNHEFNYGLDHLGRAIEHAEFPFVSANIFRHGTVEHAYTPYALLPVPTPYGDTLVIGVTGNTPPGVHVWDRDNVTGILEFRDVVSSVRTVVREMRGLGADIIVVLSHGGLEGTSYDTVTTGLPPENVAAELARQEPDIDMILLGHSHRELADTIINGVLLTQPRNWATSLSAATLMAARTAPNEWRVVRSSAKLLRPDRSVRDRAFMDSLRWEHERTVAYVNARIGHTDRRLVTAEGRVRDIELIDFINEVQRRTASADISATAAFRIDAEIPAGDITIAHMAAIYPYDNTLKAIRITGAQLRAFLEKSAEYYAGWPAAPGATVTDFSVPGYNFDIVSGVEYTLDIGRPVGQRVTSLTWQGAPVRPDQTFTMALNNYRQAGGGGYDMIAAAPVVYDGGEDVRELLIETVREHGGIPAGWHRENWRLLPEAAAQAVLREQASREIATGTAAAPTRPRLRVITTNDFHGRLEPMQPTWAGGRPVGGAAALSTYFRMEREGFQGPMVLLDGGDIMQGTPLSNLTLGRSTIDYYNHVGYGAAALGNHEFDWGTDVLRERIEQARFPWLAANIVVAGSDTTPSWLNGTAILDIGGVRVGVIGLITQETREKTMPTYVEGLSFADGARIIDRWVPELRSRGAEFVIVVAHEGAYCDEAMTRCEGTILDWARHVRHRPDLMVGGHTHEVVRTWENGIPVVESGLWGMRYVVVDLERVTPDSVDVWVRGIPVAYADRVPPDTMMTAMIARVAREVGPQLERVIAHAAEPIERGDGENAMGRLIADAQRWKADAEIAVMNAGGVRAPLEAGVVTWGDLYRVQPFGNMLTLIELSGSDLRHALEHAVAGRAPGAHISGALVEYDPARPPGSRIVTMRLANGAAIADDRYYRVVVNDFLATGVGDGYAAFARARRHRPLGVVDLDALIEYMRTLPQPVRAPRDVRIRAVGSTH